MTKGTGLGEYFQYTGRDGQILPEYHPVHQPETDETCARTDVWVECSPEAGKTFKIVAKDLRRKGNKCLYAQLLIDGRLIDSFVFGKSQRTWPTTEINLIRDGELGSYDLTFAAIKTVSDPADATAQNEDLSAIGTIAIEIAYASVSERQPTEKQWKEWGNQESSFDEIGTLWEEDVNGSENDSQSRPYTAKSQDGYDRTWVVPDSGPHYEFCIRYATRPVLERKLGLVSSGTPTSIAVPLKRSRFSSTDSSGFEIIDRPSCILSSGSRNLSSGPSRTSPVITVDSEGEISSDEEDQGELFKAFLEERKRKKKEAKRARLEAGGSGPNLPDVVKSE